jgi:hypothetical protein
MERKRIPQATETTVLLKSARRCAMCYYLNNDLSEKIGQIAHLDQDPSNYAEENLAFLCMPHHSLFDSKTSQHKNYTVQEVKEMRERLCKAIELKQHAVGPSYIGSRSASAPQTEDLVQVSRLTVAQRAAVFAADEEFRAAKANMGSSDGIAAILREVSTVFQLVTKHCEEASVKKHLGEFRKEQRNRHYILTTNYVGMILRWQQTYANLLDEHSRLLVEEYDRRILLQAELSRSLLPRNPQRIRQNKYEPELSMARKYGWRKEQSTEFISSAALADACVVQFIDLIDRDAKGELGNRGLF